MKRWSWRRWLLIAFAVYTIWFIPWVFVLHLGGVLYFPYEPDGQTRYMRFVGPVTRVINSSSGWVRSDEIAPICKKALVAAEDDTFYQHHGISLESMEKALEKNEQKGKIRWGGSTLTQQLVKNVFLSRARSYLRKSREVVGALFLDLIMSKDAQLTWYLNVVEFGPRTYGIFAASKRYFGRSPAKLSLDQCVSLMSILPDPNKSHRSIQAENPAQRVQRRKERIYRVLGVSTP